MTTHIHPAGAAGGPDCHEQAKAPQPETSSVANASRPGGCPSPEACVPADGTPTPGAGAGGGDLGSALATLDAALDAYASRADAGQSTVALLWEGLGRLHERLAILGPSWRPPGPVEATPPPRSSSPPAPEWAWMLPDGECAHGPFPSRQAAIDDFSAQAADEGYSPRVVLGHVVWLSVEDFLEYFDADDVVERSDEACANQDAWFCSEGPFFTLVGPRWVANDPAMVAAHDASDATASRELREIIRPWAEKWVEVDDKWVLEEVETVEIAPSEGSGARVVPDGGAR